MKQTLRVLWPIAWCLWASNAQAAVVEARLPNGTVGTALYSQGRIDLPAVLVLHGFLQTRNYLTVSSLTNALAEAGHPVLAPTLSLGIDRRRQTLACEALHIHTMDDDVEEIAFWVKWLQSRGHQRIVLVGHSYGSLQVVVYMSGQPSPAVKSVIATSLVDVEHLVGMDVAAKQREAAQRQADTGDPSVRPYRISYCKKYRAPADAFYSYAQWSRMRILDTLQSIDVPVEVIMGSQDKRMGSDWPSLIGQHGGRVTIIKGANHFFDASYEFDLLDHVARLIDH